MNNTNSTRRWFNWTTSEEENPEGLKPESKDQELVVPLPTKNAKTNETLVNLLNMTGSMNATNATNATTA